MPEYKDDIIRQLRKDILPLQGYKPPTVGYSVPLGLGPLETAFPNEVFPTGVIHDFVVHDEKNLGATSAFLAALLGRLMDGGGTVVWICPSGSTVAEAMAYYGVHPDRVVFVGPSTVKKALWVMEETLRCDRFVAVVGEISELTFIQSRRLQLVVEQSRVTGFLLRRRPRQKIPLASIAQWRVTPLPTQSQADRPGRGFPRWQVDILKIRNRQPVSSVVEWTGEAFVTAGWQEKHDSRKQSKTGEVWRSGI